MSNLTGPSFYKIDFEREVVLQGKSTTFLTINRNEEALLPSENLCVMLYPNSRTFESVGTFSISQTSSSGAVGNTTAEGFVEQDLSIVNQSRLNNLGVGLYVKNTQDFLPDSEGPLQISSLAVVNTGSGKITKVVLEGPTGFSPYIGATGSTAQKILNVGYYSSADQDNWRINAAPVHEIETQVYSIPGTGAASGFTEYPNPFDGSSYSATGGVEGGFTGTGMVSRDVNGFSFNSVLTNSPGMTGNRGITFRVDYESNNDSHLKLNLLIFKYDPSDPAYGALTSATPLLVPESIAGLNNPNSYSNEIYGFKSGLTGAFSDNVDYQEVHFFGYRETSVRTSRTTYQNEFTASGEIYDDRTSYALLKTNPKISGNVKLTVDSRGELSLNSFDANPALADSKYKRVPITPESQYQRDLKSFFEGTPNEIVFQLYQVDDQYQNTKRELYQQFDNFYNYGVEQLASKFYDEDFSFLAPIWLRKVVPDYFVVFRVNHPASPVTYENGTLEDLYQNFFQEARIVKTFDMRATSKLGRYLRKIVEDPRFKERPLEVSYEDDVPTTWYGISYKDATITGKGEFLSDFWKTDQPIKDFENFITGGFERNGIISTNLINLEFLFDDPEASNYSINRYFGLYVSEIQLAELELASSVMGKIPGQTPPPKEGVDGEPYSTRPFVQTNANGIQLPVDYYHSTRFANNTSNVPYYSGNVIGKLPLPSMVDDPLRIFYIKDRDNVFKRVIGLSEVDYGFPGTTEYRRVTQLELFDTQEDISKYGGPVQITSQIDSNLLNEGDSQLILNLINQGNEEVLAEEEVIELSVKNYNTSDQNFDYYFQVSSAGGTATNFVYFQDQSVTYLSSSFTQPSPGGTVSIAVPSTQNFAESETLYIVNGGYYKIVEVSSSTGAVIKNLGNSENAGPAATVGANALVGSFPTGNCTYSYTALTYLLDIDNNISLDLESGYSGNSSLYTALDSFRVLVDGPSVTQTVLNGSVGINAVVKPQYTQYRWKMTALSSGLSKGKAWAFPAEDPNGYDYISNFSNEGTPSDVARALANCINSFANSPAYATASGNRVLLKSKFKELDGNTVELTRKMVSGKSYTRNLGFYEDGNVDVVNTIELVEYSGNTSTENLGVTLVEDNTRFDTHYYYVSVLKTTGGNSIIVRSQANPESWYTVTTTGSLCGYYNQSDIFQDPSLPFALNISAISSGSYQKFVIKISYGADSSQLFVGGNSRRRSRAKIALTDGERFYQDRKIRVQSTLTSGSSLVQVASTENIYVGAPAVGTGIPANTRVLVVDGSSSTITLDQSATVSGSYELEFGNLSILNDQAFLQQWFQTAKSQFSRLKPWKVQGKYIYSLPYLEEPQFDSRNRVTSYQDQEVYRIIQVEEELQEFYLSNEKRIVAYQMYRPTLGIFSIYPVKEFDFNFFFSEYAYSPVLETFRYFFNETIENGQYVDLPADENFVLVPQIIDPSDPQEIRKISATGTFGFTLEGYNETTLNWDEIDTVSSVTVNTTDGLLINTYTPFYRYDAEEHPRRYSDPSYYLVQGSGMRNYERSLITQSKNDQTVQVLDVKKFRLKFNGSTALPFLNVKKSDYSKDSDILEFEGFAGIQDILNLNDQEEIAFLRSQGNYIEAYLRQSLASEYDRLRENFTKEFATLSRVVPYINKWVQEGTDARDNYYRLNNSLAFGISNFSPDDSVDFAEPLILSHEFPYLDTLPKDYPEESIVGSRSYMFSKLTDIAYNNKTWYELLKSDNTKNWFLKYFSLGYPSEIDYYGNLIPKSREERFTFASFTEGVNRVQTLFRGAKVQILDIDTAQATLPEIEGSRKYNAYKFSAVQRTIPYDFYALQPPLEIEIIKNDAFKTIVIVITKRTQDYRVQSGLQDYLFSYAQIDNLKNYNQQQYKLGGFTGTALAQPYTSTFTGDYTTQSTARPRQLYMGAGYLQIGDPKLSGHVDTQNSLPEYSTANDLLTVFLKSSEESYPFVVSDEVSPFENKYPVGNTVSTYPFIYDFSQISILPYGMGQEGLLNKFISTGETNSRIFTYDFTDGRQVADAILPDSVRMSSPERYQNFREVLNTSTITDALNVYATPHGSYPFSTTETFNLQGGNTFYENSKSLTSFANIKRSINTDSGFVKYYKVTASGAEATADYKLRIVSGDQIVKTGVLNYVVDEDKPPQYQNAPVIGYNIVNTNQNELIIRHRGFYEPKSLDIISFWVREDESVTEHFERDFLLSNTRINNKFPSVGIISNYGINKVALTEILKISQGTAYQSVYQLIHEISVDSKDSQVLHSTWDAGYYRRYTDLNIYAEVDGYNEMQEFKSFLGSKAMTVPKKIDLETFLDTEVTFTLTAPSVSDGLTQNSNGTTKPTLTISLELESRLVRELLSQMEDPNSVDDFDWAKETLGLNLTAEELAVLKESYVRKNILPLYEVSDVLLYALKRDGVPLLIINLSEAEKLAGGYRVDKDCVTTQLGKWSFTLTKTLDTKVSVGYSVGVIVKRV